MLSALRSLGLRVPEDVSVIAYDEMPLADYLDPPLDTIAMPLDELGRTAVQAVVDQIDGGTPHDIVIPIAPQIVLRGSTTPARLESRQP